MSEPAGSEPPTVVIRLAADQAERISYIREVLAGNRPAAARGHRRVQLDLPVLWRSSTGQHRSRITDLSRGGAFIISSDVPNVGTRLEIEIDTGAAPLRFPSVVSWIRTGVGFGVNFKLADRTIAEQLTAVVRRRAAELEL